MAEIITADGVKIYIAAKDSVGSALVAGDEHQASVTNIDASGGAQELDSVRTFGGYLDKKKVREQFEITMDVIIRLDSTDETVAVQWDDLNDGGTVKRMVAIQGGNATDGYYWNAWNNVSSINFDKEFAAEDEWKGTITFKLSPTTEDGNQNSAYGSSTTEGITGITDGLLASHWS